MRHLLIHTLAVTTLVCAAGCGQRGAAAPSASEIDVLTVETANAGRSSEGDHDAAGDAWAIGIARRAIEERERAEDWPHGADYRVIRRSAVQSWVIARRIAGYDAVGAPRFTELWDRGIIIDELGDVMFYVPAK